MTQQEILQWLAEPPFDNPAELRKKPAFSYHDWFKKGRDILEIIPSLIDLLKKDDFQKSTDMPVRIIYALGWIGDKSCIDVLMPYLENSDSTIRSEAIASLGRLKATEAFDRIKKLAKEKKYDSNVRGNACISLGLIGLAESKNVLTKIEKEKDPFLVHCAREGLKLLAGI